MNYAALFAFIIRLVGLYFLYSATAQVIFSLGVTTLPGGQQMRMFSSFSLLSLIGQLLAAMWFFKGAPPFSGWAYQELTNKKADS